MGARTATTGPAESTVPAEPPEFLPLTARMAAASPEPVRTDPGLREATQVEELADLCLLLLRSARRGRLPSYVGESAALATIDEARKLVRALRAGIIMS